MISRFGHTADKYSGTVILYLCRLPWRQHVKKWDPCGSIDVAISGHLAGEISEVATPEMFLREEMGGFFRLTGPSFSSTGWLVNLDVAMFFCKFIGKIILISGSIR